MCDRMILLNSGRCLWLTDGCCCVLNSIIESREAETNDGGAVSITINVGFDTCEKFWMEVMPYV